MQVEFHNKANSIYASICQGFEIALSNISRLKNEDKFQQFKKQYAAKLEQELRQVAKRVLAKFKK